MEKLSQTKLFKFGLRISLSLSLSLSLCGGPKQIERRLAKVKLMWGYNSCELYRLVSLILWIWNKTKDVGSQNKECSLFMNLYGGADSYKYGASQIVKFH